MSWLWQRVCVCSLIFLLQVLCTSPKILTNITDKFGNVADQNSRLYFAKFSKHDNYASKIRPLFDDGLLPFYKMSRMIAKSSFGFDYPYELVVALAGKQYAAFFSLSPGMAFSTSLGAVLVLIFVILALCMPCTLCCCCKRRNKPLPSFNKVAFRGAFLGMLVVFTLAGLGATVQITRHLAPTGAQSLEDGENALDDLGSFLNNAVEELFLIFDQLDFTKTVFYRDLDNIGTLVGAPLLDAIVQKTKLMDAANALRRLAEVSAESSKTLQMVSADLELLKDQIKALNNVTQTFPGGSAVSVPSPQVDLQAAQDDFRKLGNLDLLNSVDEGMTQLNDIPEKIDNSSRDIVEEIKGNLNATQESLNGFKDAIQDMKDSALKGVGLDKQKKTLNSSEKYVDAFRQYSGAVSGVLTGIQFLCVFLVLIGAVIVILAYKLNLPALKATGNEDKGKIKTTHGGKIIYCGMMFFVLVAWIFMLICLAFFVIGAPLEGLVCQVVNDPDFTIIDKLMEDKRLTGEHNGTWLAGKILSVPTSTATIGSVLRDCRDDKTMFKATDMTEHPSANFTQLVDFKDQLNITALLSGVSVDVGNVDLLGGDVDQYLKNMDNLQDHIPFAQLLSLSSQVNASAKMSEFGATLPAPQRQTFSAAVDGNLQEIDKLTENIKKNSAKLQASLGDIKTQTNNSRTAALAAQSRIDVACGEERPKAIDAFVNRLNMMIETFINASKRGVMEDYGKCGPLYTIFQVIMQNAVCGNVANIINGLWLGLGWSQLFLLVTASVGVGMCRMLPAPSNAKFEVPYPPPRPTEAGTQPTNSATVAPLMSNVAVHKDRQEDRQEEDRQENRQEDRQEDRQENRQEENRQGDRQEDSQEEQKQNDNKGAEEETDGTDYNEKGSTSVDTGVQEFTGEKD